MEQSDTFIIAKEGWKFLIGSIAAFVIFIILDWDFLQLLSLVAAILFAYVYRNPERIVPYYQENSIVSVADGRVRSIETVESCPMLEGPCYKVEIVSGFFDTSLLRMPYDAEITEIDLRRGSRLSAVSSLAAQLNEQARLFFKNEAGHSCVVEHMLDQSIDALSLHGTHGRNAPQGSRYGLMLRGTHSIYLPAKSRVALKVGDEVRAGETLVGYFA